MKIKNVNWLDEAVEGEKLLVKIRFAHRGALATVRAYDEGYVVQFDQPQRSITPGQAAVMYRQGQLVGGGWIV